MTTHAASLLRPPAEEQTGALAIADSDVVLDALPRLDYRARSRTIPDRLARRGPHLALQDGDETRLIPLEQRITHIGRGLLADVRLEDQRVSRSHAIIVRHGRYARLLDNRSANGTYLNGRRIVATNIRNGDQICVGPLAMRYVEVG
jgi:hypothetical protein